MRTETETVADRVAAVRVELTPLQLAVGLALVVAAAGLLAVAQEPVVHNALHDFRHVSGITCH